MAARRAPASAGTARTPCRAPDAGQRPVPPDPHTCRRLPAMPSPVPGKRRLMEHRQSGRAACPGRRSPRAPPGDRRSRSPATGPLPARMPGLSVLRLDAETTHRATFPLAVASRSRGRIAGDSQRVPSDRMDEIMDNGPDRADPGRAAAGRNLEGSRAGGHAGRRRGGGRAGGGLRHAGRAAGAADPRSPRSRRPGRRAGPAAAAAPAAGAGGQRAGRGGRGHARIGRCRTGRDGARRRAGGGARGRPRSRWGWRRSSCSWTRPPAPPCWPAPSWCGCSAGSRGCSRS